MTLVARRSGSSNKLNWTITSATYSYRYSHLLATCQIIPHGDLDNYRVEQRRYCGKEERGIGDIEEREIAELRENILSEGGGEQ